MAGNTVNPGLGISRWHRDFVSGADCQHVLLGKFEVEMVIVVVYMKMSHTKCHYLKGLGHMTLLEELCHYRGGL